MTEQRTLRRRRMHWHISLPIAILIIGLLLTSSRLGVGAAPAVVIVDGATGSDTAGCGVDGSPCETIAYALSQHGGQGATILIAPGTYTENLTIDGDVTLRGGYAGTSSTSLGSNQQTAIHAGHSGRAVSVIGGQVTLESLAITGGNCQWGGGVLIVDGTVTITDTMVHDNLVAQGGGGVWAEGNETSVTIHSSAVYSNTALGQGGGGIGTENATVHLLASTLSHNHAPNGQSGAIDARTNSAVSVQDCTIAGNTARDHGGAMTVDPGALVDVTNALITGNSTTSGNANVLAIGGGTVTMLNTTVTANNPQGAQAVLLWSGSLDITNSIWWDNALNIQGDPPCEQCFSVTYSDVQGGFAGEGNIDADPMFIGGGSYKLAAGSPCIDSGTDVGAPDHDLAGNLRPADGDSDGTATTDMGAYEVTQYGVYLPWVMGRGGQ